MRRAKKGGGGGAKFSFYSPSSPRGGPQWGRQFGHYPRPPPPPPFFFFLLFYSFFFFLSHTSFCSSSTSLKMRRKKGKKIRRVLFDIYTCTRLLRAVCRCIRALPCFDLAAGCCELFHAFSLASFSGCRPVAHKTGKLVQPIVVSRFDQAVRRSAGKRKDLGLIPQCQPFL